MNFFVRNHENGTLALSAQTPTIPYEELPVREVQFERHSAGLTFIIQENFVPGVSMPRYIFGGRFKNLNGADLYDGGSGLSGSTFRQTYGHNYAFQTPYCACLIMDMDSDDDGVKDADAQDWYPVVFVINYLGYGRAAVYYYRDGYSREATPILYYIDTNAWIPTGNSIRQGHSSYDPGLPYVIGLASIPTEGHSHVLIIDEREEDYLYKKVRDLEIQMRGMQKRIDALEAEGGD